MGFSLDPSNWGQDLGDAASAVSLGAVAFPFETLAYAGAGIAAPFDQGSSFNWLNQYNAALASNGWGAIGAAGGLLSGSPSGLGNYLAGGLATMQGPPPSAPVGGSGMGLVVVGLIGILLVALLVVVL